jgi:hypothetical protein
MPWSMNIGRTDIWLKADQQPLNRSLHHDCLQFRSQAPSDAAVHAVARQQAYAPAPHP